MRAHALLSASGSTRWIACPPSARLEDKIPDTTSIFAEEGTFAHSLGELFLQLELGIIQKRSFNSKLKKLKESEFYSTEMEDYIAGYVALGLEKINEARAKTKDAVALLEQRLDFSPWVPDGFGTGDLVIIADGMLEVVDLKYGKGVPVSAENNTQMRLYALGALNCFDMLYDIDTVRMTICQPRLDSVSTDEMSVEDLLAWGEEIKPIAQMAMEGEGDFAAGEHCRFCKIKATCRARAEENLELAKYDFQKPPELTIAEIGEVLAQAEELRKWATDIQDHALEQARDHGVKFPGWKLVEGRSNRKYTDEALVAYALKAAGYKEDDIYTKNILGITAMEKTLGQKKFSSLLKDLVIKPEGKPTLALESDKRPEISSAASAAEDFK